jgi:hypothetical protein
MVVTVLTPATTTDLGFTAVLVGLNYSLIVRSRQTEIEWFLHSSPISQGAVNYLSFFTVFLGFDGCGVPSFLTGQGRISGRSVESRMSAST